MEQNTPTPESLARGSPPPDDAHPAANLPLPQPMNGRSLGRDVGWLWAGYAGRSLGYFGLIVVFTHALGTAGFGVLALFLAVTLGVSQVAGSWPFLAVPVLSAREGSIGAAFRPSFYVALLATAASLVIALPLCLVIGIDSPVSLVCIVVSSFALVFLQGIFAVQQTEGRMTEIALLQTGERVVALVLALAGAILTGIGVIGAQLLLTVAAVVTAVAAISIVHRRQQLLRSSDGLPDHLISTVMNAVGAMGIVSVASYGVAYADIFILALFRSDSDVGIYSLAYQIFSFVTQLATYWLVAALPEHARSTAEGHDLLEQLPVARLVKYSGLWAAMIALSGVAAAFLLPLVFGPDFEKTATPLLLLLGGSGVFAATYFALLPALIGAGRSDLVAQVAIGSVVINIGLDLALVPMIGINGPAFATFGQSVFGTATLAGIVLGGRSTLRLMAIGAPAAAATMLLAADPDDVRLAGLCVLSAIVTAAWSLRSKGSGGPAPEGAGISTA
jgi:O-antigen/teichoic acid export membrane protein